MSDSSFMLKIQKRQLRPGSERENGLIGFRPSGFKRSAFENPSSGIDLQKRLQISDFDF